MKNLTTALAGLFFCMLASLGQAEEKAEKTVAADPSGTWRWNFEINGDSIENVLKLDIDKDGKLIGTLEARDLKMKVQEGKVTGNEVSFQVEVKLEQTVTVKFQGRIEGDSIDGKLTAKGDGDSREFPWEPKRSVLASDVVGAWQLTIVTPAGEKLEPILTITKKGEDLLATYANNDKTVDAQELTLKDNQLAFEVESEYNGAPLHVEFKGRTQGARMKGSLEYSVDGNMGELEFTGMRKAEAE